MVSVLLPNNKNQKCMKRYFIFCTRHVFKNIEIDIIKMDYKVN